MTKCAIDPPQKRAFKWLITINSAIQIQCFGMDALLKCWINGYQPLKCFEYVWILDALLKCSQQSNTQRSGKKCILNPTCQIPIKQVTIPTWGFLVANYRGNWKDWGTQKYLMWGIPCKRWPNFENKSWILSRLDGTGCVYPQALHTPHTNIWVCSKIMVPTNYPSS